MAHRPSVLLLILLALFLIACAEQGAESEALREYARNATPENADLSEIYQRSCKTCHARTQSGAPLTGDAERWDALLTEKGMDSLVHNTIDGFGGMPPMGHCMDCGRDEFEALIRFMATPPEEPQA